jgi:hypothetical protein
MHRRAGVRPQALIGLVSAHPLAMADPYMAWLVSDSQMNHVVPSTRKGYETAIRSYTTFCQNRRLAPWPVDEVKMVGWMLYMGQKIKSTSLRKYMSALPYGQALQHEHFPWTLAGCEPVRKALRYIRHRYPCSPKASKLPISLALIYSLVKVLPGWPVVARLSFDDLLWLTASVIVTSAFLRGGEFLASSDSDRAILSMSAVEITTLRSKPVLIVKPPQPKTRMDLTEVSIPCFAPPSAGALGPVALFEAYCKRSPIVGSRAPGLIPAFHRVDGSALSKDFMKKRTLALMRLAKIEVVCPAGLATKILASSWRAGGVRSAMDANIPESIIMELGRWRSAAWRHYLLFSPLDIQGACRRMWEAGAAAGGVDSVVLQGGRSFDSLPSTRSVDDVAVARAKSQLQAIIESSTSDPVDRLARLSAASAMVDSTVVLLRSCDVVPSPHA